MKATVLLFLLSGVVAGKVSAQKNDTVYLLNGDRITGEFKVYRYGQLLLKTDAMRTIYVEFDKISTVHSSKFFEVLMNEGTKFFGSIRKSETPGILVIVSAKDTIPLPLADIVQMTKIRKTFFSRIDGSASLGFSYTKASDVLQFNVAMDANYRTKKYSATLSLNSILTNQMRDSVSNLSSNTNTGLDLTRFLPGKWFLIGSIKGQQNTELDLRFRLQGGLGGGYDILRSNKIRFFGFSGLIYNYEQTIDSSITSNNAEVVGAIHLKWFQFRIPKIDFTTGIDFFYNLVIKNRIRLEYDMVAKFELVRDLFLSLTVYDSFDSKPFLGSDAKNDYGAIVSIGYSF